MPAKKGSCFSPVQNKNLHQNPNISGETRNKYFQIARNFRNRLAIPQRQPTQAANIVVLRGAMSTYKVLAIKVNILQIGLYLSFVGSNCTLHVVSGLYLVPYLEENYAANALS
jgi:hypothetical protein